MLSIHNQANPNSVLKAWLKNPQNEKNAKCIFKNKTDACNIYCLDGAKLFISQPAYKTFLRLYAQDIDNNTGVWFISELGGYKSGTGALNVLNVSKLFFELDFYCKTHEDRQAFKANTKYINTICRHLSFVIYNILNMKEKKMVMYVMSSHGEEKPGNSEKGYAVGIHIVVDGVFVSFDIMKEISEACVSHMMNNEPMDDMFQSSWMDSIDSQPYIGQNLRLCGSKKCDRNHCKTRSCDECVFGFKQVNRWYIPWLRIEFNVFKLQTYPLIGNVPISEGDLPKIIKTDDISKEKLGNLIYMMSIHTEENGNYVIANTHVKRTNVNVLHHPELTQSNTNSKKRSKLTRHQGNTFEIQNDDNPIFETIKSALTKSGNGLFDRSSTSSSSASVYSLCSSNSNSDNRIVTDNSIIWKDLEFESIVVTEYNNSKKPKTTSMFDDDKTTSVSFRPNTSSNSMQPPFKYCKIKGFYHGSSCIMFTMYLDCSIAKIPVHIISLSKSKANPDYAIYQVCASHKSKCKGKKYKFNLSKEEYIKILEYLSTKLNQIQQTKLDKNDILSALMGSKNK